MYTFNCIRCSTEFEKKRPTTCRDGEHRCTTCQDAIKSKKYQQTVTGKASSRASVKKYRKTDKGRAVRRTTWRRHRAKNVEWYRLKSKAWNHGLKTIDLIELFGKQPVCGLCGIAKNLSLDHMMPTARGGASTKDNLQVLCLSCNVWKSDKLFLADGSGYLVGESYGR